MSKYYVNYQYINQNTYNNKRFINNKNMIYNTQNLPIKQSKIYIDLRTDDALKNYINHISLQCELLQQEKYKQQLMKTKEKELLNDILLNYDILERRTQQEEEVDKKYLEEGNKIEEISTTSSIFGKIINVFKIW